jgi:hypothetical protein
MAVPLNTSSHHDRALKALERERKEEADGRAAAWTVVWTLFAFKMLTVAIIWYAASGSNEANGLLVATTWYWVFIPIVAFSGAIAYRWRLVKMRRQREALRQSEWTTPRDDDTGVALSDAEVRQLIHPARDERLHD